MLGGKKMGKYIDDSKALLEYIGGKENISAVTHCVTRMRFVLKDTSKADKEKIEVSDSDIEKEIENRSIKMCKRNIYSSWTIPSNNWKYSY